MNAKLNLPSNFRQLVKDAQKKLKSFGYEEVCSKMSDSPDGNKFGMLFMRFVDEKRAGETWLNYITLDSILKAETPEQIPQV